MVSRQFLNEKEEEKRELDDLNKFVFWKIAKDIYMCENSDMMTTKKLSDEIGVKYTNAYFYLVLNFLKKKEGVRIINKLQNLNLIEINHIKLKQILEESEVYDCFIEFIDKKTKGFYQTG